MNDSPSPYRLRDVSVPLEQLVNPAIGVSLLLLALPLIPHALLWGVSGGDLGAFALGTLATALLIVAHEAVHALGWIVFGGVPPAAMRFGVHWGTLSPYAHASAPMPARGYRIGAVLPLFVTGLLPALLGTVTNTGWLTLAGAILTMGAAGDVLVLRIIRALPGTTRVLDHPQNAGCYVVEE